MTALAVVPGRFVVSVGHRHVAEDMKLWNCSGNLLCQLARWHDPARWRKFARRGKVPRRQRGTIHKVDGISVVDTTLCLMTDYGARLVLFNLETRKAIGNLKPRIRPPCEGEGFRNSNLVVVANGATHTAPMLDIKQLSAFPHLIPPGTKDDHVQMMTVMMAPVVMARFPRAHQCGITEWQHVAQSNFPKRVSAYHSATGTTRVRRSWLLQTA